MSLGLKNGSSGGIGMKDLIEVLRAFEHTNSVMITLTGRSVLTKAGEDLQWEAKAWETQPTLSGRQLLASASVRCLEKRLGTMEAVVLQLLYALDFMLGEREFESAEPKS
jgi:hypothetical protein